ncbi:MAG TPA: hypothetical protein ENI67_03430 [Gammaproteobacteria bacterium]|nr:hypothetical protein [Gammaproteobacteria bacterium]
MERSSPEHIKTSFLTKKAVLRLLFIMVLTWLPALIGAQLVRDVVLLYPLGNSANPYFIPQHGLLLYVGAPMVVISSCAFLLSPGLLFALAFNGGISIGRWMVSGFALSTVMVSITAGVVQSVMDVPLTGNYFSAVVILIALAGFATLFYRVEKDSSIQSPFSTKDDKTILALIVTVPFIILIVLLPKFFWENFNGDGAHAYEAGRLLLHFGLPFWPESTPTSSYPGTNSMLSAFHVSWFIRMFGEFELSSRLPLILYLIPLFGGMLSLINEGRKNIGIKECALIWLSITIYVIVVSFSTTYDPYSSDIAMPGVMDTLIIVSYLGFVLSFVRNEKLWMLLFLILTYTTSPAGLMLIGLWFLASALIFRKGVKQQLLVTFLGILACIIFASVAPKVFSLLNINPPGTELDSGGMLRKFAFLNFVDFQKLLYLIIPSGIYTVFGFLIWKGLDKLTKTLALVTIIYFSVFYVMAFYSLHYFIATMLLPLIVFWRNSLIHNPEHKTKVLTASAIAGFFALWISLPNTTKIYTESRIVGSSISNKIEGYDKFSADAFIATNMLYHLFPADADPKVPRDTYGGSPISWNYYAHKPNDRVIEKNNYVLQYAKDMPPLGMMLAKKDNLFALYVKNENTWEKHKALRPITPVGSKIYQINRDVLFGRAPAQKKEGIINLSEFELIRQITKKFMPDLYKIYLEKTSKKTD